MSFSQQVSEVVAFYLPALIGGVAQFVFLAFPVNLRNWVDDDLNALTYVAIQTLMACIIFVGVPVFFDIFTLGAWRSFVILSVVFVAASIRAYRLIPLEFTFPVSAATEVIRRVDFTEFNNPLRQRALAEVSLNESDGSNRFATIRERISRRRPERMDRVAKS